MSHWLIHIKADFLFCFICFGRKQDVLYFSCRPVIVILCHCHYFLVGLVPGSTALQMLSTNDSAQVRMLLIVVLEGGYMTYEATKSLCIVWLLWKFYPSRLGMWHVVIRWKPKLKLFPHASSVNLKSGLNHIICKAQHTICVYIKLLLWVTTVRH